MQHDDQGRPVLVLTMLVLIVLVLFMMSAGVGWLVATWTGGSRSVPTRLGPVAGLPAASPTPSVAGSAPSSGASAAASLVPSPTQFVQPTVTTTLPALTSAPSPSSVPPTNAPPSPTFEPSPTSAPPSPTNAPSSTPPAATSGPTEVIATATPALSISVVNVPRAFVYDSPSGNQSIIGGVERGDELEVLGQRSTWYLVRVYRAASPRSRIEGGQGWIAQDEVQPPSLPVPVLAP